MELLAGLFFAALLIWLIPVARSGHLPVVAMVVLAAGTIFGPSFFAVDSVIQFSVDRLLWFAMLLLVVVGWRFGYSNLPQLNRVDWLVIGITTWFLISALRGGPIPTGSSPTARWLFYVMMPAGMYAVARMVSLHHSDVRWLQKGAVALGIYLAVTAVFETTGLHGLVFPRYIVDAEVWEFYGRGRGPLMNPAGNGIVISLSLIAAILLVVYGTRLQKILYTVAAILLFAGVYATLTRSVWLGAVAAPSAIAMIFAPRWVRVLGLVTIVLLAAASTMGLKDELLSLKRDKNLSAADAAKSVELRPLLAVVAWEMFKENPVTGHGFGHYFEHQHRYYSNRSYGLPLEQARGYAQHNVFLSVLVDTGLIGLSMFVAWLCTTAAIGWKLARQMSSAPEARCVGLLTLGTLVVYFCNGLFHDVMIIPMVQMFLFFILGVAVTTWQRGLVSQRCRRGEAEPDRIVRPLGI